MFDEIIRSGRPLALFALEGGLVVAEGGSLGLLGGSREPVDVIAGGERSAAESIIRVCGVWPDAVWIDVHLGWGWAGMPGGPGSPVPRTAVARRDEAGAWIAQPELSAVFPWPGDALGASRDLWAAARMLETPEPAPTLGEGAKGVTFEHHVRPVEIQIAGGHAFATARVVSAPERTSHWWFPPGERVGRRLELGVAPVPEHARFAPSATEPDRIYASGPGSVGAIEGGVYRSIQTWSGREVGDLACDADERLWWCAGGALHIREGGAWTTAAAPGRGVLTFAVGGGVVWLVRNAPGESSIYRLASQPG